MISRIAKISEITDKQGLIAALRGSTYLRPALSASKKKLTN
jgi:hypothetical protein